MDNHLLFEILAILETIQEPQIQQKVNRLKKLLAREAPAVCEDYGQLLDWEYK